VAGSFRGKIVPPTLKKSKERDRYGLALMVFTIQGLRRAVSVMVVEMMMTTMVVRSSKCGSSSRYQHQSKKSEGNLPHDASLISRARRNGKTTLCVRP
jgi:hypothetical protein